MTEKPNIVTIGAATLDRFLEIDEKKDSAQQSICFRIGVKKKISDIQEYFGGGATNVAVNLASQGFAVACAACIGNDETGKKIKENLESNNVNTELLQTSQCFSANSTVLHDKYSKDRSILAYAGASEDLQFPNLPENLQCVILNHLAGKSQKILQKVFDFIKTNRNIFLAWNPGQEQLEQGLEANKEFLKQTKALFINKEEAELLLNKQASIEELLEEFKTLNIPYVFISDGKNGASLLHKNKIFFEAIHEKMPLVDTTGAGDAFLSGAVAAILNKKIPEEILYDATESAGICVSQNGAQTAFQIADNK